MCMIDDAEAVDFCCSKVRTARKTHKCSECDRQILKAEKYFHSVFKIDDSMGTNKRCSHCDIAAQWLSYHCGGWVMGSIKDELMEHYDEGYREDGLQHLVIGIRRQ